MQKEGGMEIVNMQDVTIQYGTDVIIDKLSLQVKRGENLAIVGPSSCGKTTLMRALCGFIKINHGEILLNGHIVSSSKKRIMLPPEKRKIGVVFQDYAVWPHLSVLENISYPLKKMKVPRDEIKKRSLDALAQVKMIDFGDRLPSQLSGGQQQRVALARALVSSSDLIVLDEPITNLDAKLREEMAYEIRNLQNTMGITVIYITHDQETAMTISDRMVILDKKGSIQQIGMPEEIWTHPKDRDVYKFLGVSNFLPVRLQNEKLILMNFSGDPQTMPMDEHKIPGNQKDYFLASRPMEIQLKPMKDKDVSGFSGMVERVTYLGNQFDYILNAGGHLLRVQQDSLEAFQHGVPEEGSVCKLEFLNPMFYPAD